MVAAKLRLVVALAVALAISGAFGLALWYRGQALAATAARDGALTSLAAVTAANAAQTAALERLTAGRAIDDKLLTDLQGRLGELATQTQQATNAIRDLERSNEDVKKYLAGRLPDELRRLLDASPAGSERADRHQ